MNMQTSVSLYICAIKLLFRILLFCAELKQELDEQLNAKRSLERQCRTLLKASEADKDALAEEKRAREVAEVRLRSETETVSQLREEKKKLLKAKNDLLDARVSSLQQDNEGWLESHSYMLNN